MDSTDRVLFTALLNIIPQFTEIVNTLLKNLLTVAVTDETTVKVLK